MKTLLIDGSERDNGNCHQLAIYTRDLMQGFGCSVTIIHLRNYDIQPCGQCLDCNVRDHACGVVDDTADIVAIAGRNILLEVQYCEKQWCKLATDQVRGWTTRQNFWGVLEDEEVN